MVSLIIVNYHVKKELFSCIQSIYHSKPKSAFEIIVVDNDEIKTIEKELKKKFPKVIYIPNENKGFGQGNNVGAKNAKGEFLFFLNPDTRLLNNAIDTLIDLLQSKKNIGIVAPTLYHADGKPFVLQGLGKLTPITAIFSLSFIHKLFPKNPIARYYWDLERDKTSNRDVDAVPGTALVMSKNLFDELGGFDEHFFLYFEETDLCKRVLEKGLKLIMTPDAKVFHAWEQSTKKSNKNISKIFTQSRFYYLKKHFGLLPAFFSEAILRINKYTLLVTVIFLIGFSLRIYKLDRLMIFISDQGWFYISARDMLLTGKIPLLGITSSHTWLHQGPLWTYILAILFSIFHFNPLAPGYFTAFVGSLTIVAIYLIGSKLFSERIGIFSALLYATSPFIITFDRMPYHTSLIPLFSLLFYLFLYLWVNGNKYFFPLCILCLTTLYNLELATISLGFIFVLVVAYGFYKKKEWVTKLFNRYVISFSLFAFFIPMLPMLLYDSAHGFPQTIKFTAWLVYHFFQILRLPVIHSVVANEPLAHFFQNTLKYTQRMIFVGNSAIAVILLVCSLLVLFKKIFFNNQKNVSLNLLGLWLIIPLTFYLVNKTSSGAYLPALFPSLVFTLSLTFDQIYSTRKFGKILAIVIILAIVLINTYLLLEQNYYSQEITPFSNRITAAKLIVKLANGKKYNIIGSGVNSQFESFTTNTEYLTWWFGNGPTHMKEKMQFIISEDNLGVHVTQRNKKS